MESKLFEKIYLNNHDLYEEIANDFNNLSSLFCQYFDLFEPKVDLPSTSLRDSKIHLSEVNVSEKERVLKELSSEMKIVTDRINNLYQNFFNQHIKKGRSDWITQGIVSRLRESTIAYQRYLNANTDDPDIEEVKTLFSGYVKQSKVLNSVLDSKNKNNQSADQQLELIYTKEGKLNVGILQQFDDSII